MKKMLAFLLALTLLLSVGVAAFADPNIYEESIGNMQEHTQTITVNAPALTWTLEIPANLEIEFENTDLIEMGNLKISDVSWATLPGDNFIFVTLNTSKRLDSTTGNSSIDYDLSCRYHDLLPQNNGREMISSLTEPEADENPSATYHSTTEQRWSAMFIQIAARRWQDAVPGEKYTGMITYSSHYGKWF